MKSYKYYRFNLRRRSIVTNKQNRIFIALSIILFLSGSYSLIYQIAWVRFLTLLLGSTTMGITTVVASFMSGLAIGSWLASKYLITKEKPLKVYALLELIIAITAAISPLLFKWAFASLPTILQNFGEANISIFIIRIIFSAVIMLIPTIAMGAALPVLGKYLQQYTKLAERRITIIYGINTIGACVGSLLAGYFLLRVLGLINTIYVTAGANALLPIAILLLPDISDKRDLKKEKKKKSLEDKYFIQGKSLSPGARNVILIISAIVGFIGLASELVWTRMIVLTVGGSIYAFSTILSVYLFFYGVGATIGGFSLKFIAVRFGEKAYSVSRSIFFMLIFLLPVATTITIAVANFLPVYYIHNFNIDTSSSAYGLLVNQLFPAIMLMGPATLLSGVFFTYGLFMMKQCSDTPAANTSFFYTWNTVGGITGSVAAAFLLIPYLGLDHTLRITSTLLIVAGFISVFLMKMKKIRLILISASVSLLIVWFVVPAIDEVAISSGSGVYTIWYQKNANVIEKDIGKYLDKYYDQIYYRDGFTSTITTSRDKYTKELSVSTNGKIDGSSYSDMPSQKLFAHFPALFHPNPKNACVIGFGTGTTVGSLAMHPGIKVDAIEIEPAIIEAAEYLNDYNNDPLSRKNVKLHLTDGRLHLQRNIGKYDLITSEPSNPWIAGVSDLFTVDFYRLAKNALTPNGVFGQWVQMYRLKPEALRLVVRTFQEVFPNVYVVILYPKNDLMMIGCKGSYRPKLEEIKKRISKSDIAADIAAEPVNINDAYELFARLVLGPEQTRKFAGVGSVNTDFMPTLSYMAPLSLFDSTAHIAIRRYIPKYLVPNTKTMGWDHNKEEMDKLQKKQKEYLIENFLMKK